MFKLRINYTSTLEISTVSPWFSDIQLLKPLFSNCLEKGQALKFGNFLSYLAKAACFKCTARELNPLAATTTPVYIIPQAFILPFYSEYSIQYYVLTIHLPIYCMFANVSKETCLFFSCKWGLKMGTLNGWKTDRYFSLFKVVFNLAKFQFSDVSED